MMTAFEINWGAAAMFGIVFWLGVIFGVVANEKVASKQREADHEFRMRILKELGKAKEELQEAKERLRAMEDKPKKNRTMWD